MIWYVLGFLRTAAFMLLGVMRQMLKLFPGQQLQKQLLPFPKVFCLRWSCWEIGTTRTRRMISVRHL